MKDPNQNATIDNPELEAMRRENERLKARLTRAEKRIDEIKHDPQALITHTPDNLDDINRRRAEDDGEPYADAEARDRSDKEMEKRESIRRAMSGGVFMIGADGKVGAADPEDI